MFSDFNRKFIIRERSNCHLITFNYLSFQKLNHWVNLRQSWVGRGSVEREIRFEALEIFL